MARINTLSATAPGAATLLQTLGLQYNGLECPSHIASTALYVINGTNAPRNLADLRNLAYCNPAVTRLVKWVAAATCQN